jgi:hypothetical protein
MGSSTTPTFSIMQQAFALSMWSNLAGSSTGTSQSLSLILKEKIEGTDKVPGKLQTYATEVGSDWTVVWGPFAYAPDTLAVNAAFIANSPSQNLYVVAIAATNERSVKDWNNEDFNVATNVPFPIAGLPSDGAASVTGAVVSKGTSIGVTNLLTQLGGAGNSIADFLTGLQNSGKSAGNTLIFTGHSLGGALSPTLAAQIAGAAETQAKWAQVLVLPTAGATPGNAAFAALFDTGGPFAVPATQTGQQTVSVPDVSAAAGIGTAPANWNTLVWNQYDVVPHAWDLLSEVFTHAEGGDTSLYGPVGWPLSDLLSDAMNKATKAATSGGPYARLVQNLIVTPPTAPGFKPPYSEPLPFLEMLAQQHISAYFGIFDVMAIYDADAQSFTAHLIQDIEALLRTL